MDSAGVTLTKGDTTSSRRSLYSEGGNEEEGAGVDGSEFRFDVTPLGSGRQFWGTEGSIASGSRGVPYNPRTREDPSATAWSPASTRGYYHAGQRYQSPETAAGSAGARREIFGGLKRSGSGEMSEQGMEDLSEEENRVFLGMQQRQEARESGDEMDSTVTSSASERALKRAAEGIPPRENRL